MTQFNRVSLGSRERDYVLRALESGHLAGDGAFTRSVTTWLAVHLPSVGRLLTHSATGALEMAALLLDVQPGDEIIMPSYTFPSTANAFVLRGAVPVFVDVRGDTANLDETLVEEAITRKTRAIVPVHYAGVASAMDELLAIAGAHKLHVVEDAAQGLGASYKHRALGTIGDLACLSFHESKNFVCGEGGALLINRDGLTDRAEIIREKGTDRSRFFRGDVDKYTWQDVGSSYLPSDLLAAVLLAQLERLPELHRKRLSVWNRFHEGLAFLEQREQLRRPIVPVSCQHNGHIYAVQMPSEAAATVLRAKADQRAVRLLPHYVPLHSSPAGIRFGRTGRPTLPETDRIASTLLRLPIWPDMEDEDIACVLNVLDSSLRAS